MIRELKFVYLSNALLLNCILASTSSFSQNNDPGYACDKGGETRYVKIVREAEFACRVKYKKPSGTSYPWNARNEADYCEAKAIGLVKKLGTFGWECYSDEDINSILLAQIDRYGRYLKILNNVGKTCHFYPSEAQFGNLCGDERNEAVIAYTCEADAGRWDQHLAVFLEIEAEPLIKEVGSSGYRQVSSYYIDDERVVMEMEKIDSNQGASASPSAPEKTSIQCLYSAASKWKLIEN